MTLIRIPCWWDGTLESVLATICFQRPDLGTTIFDPIPPNPPIAFFSSLAIPDVGELMLASFSSDPEFTSSIPENKWWMGEKYDGVRCCWHPKRKLLYLISCLLLFTRYSRSAREISLPLQIKRDLPSIFIDGEIWFGRGAYNMAQKVIQQAEESLQWQFFKLIAFDVPVISFHRTEFEKRFTFLLENVPPDHQSIITAARVLCKNKKHLSFFTQHILEDGGEGAILQFIKSFYERGRSPLVIKLKAAQGDSEALVVETNSDNSIILELPNSRVFVVPPQNVNLPNPPKKGEVVTYTYDVASRRPIPMSPKVVRVREDVAWDEVVAQHQREVQARSLNEYSRDAVNFKNESHGYWTAGKGKNMRAFLEGFAKKMNLDPLLPSTWYLLSRGDIKKAKGGATVVSHFKGGYVKSIMKLFPEIGLDENKFYDYTGTSYHWLDIMKRRVWFEEYAEEKGFEPLVPENWYNITMERIRDPQAIAILQHYSGNIVKALRHLFPEIELDSKQFIPIYRRYFETFVAKRGLDPLLPRTWYSLRIPPLFNWKRGRRILSFYSYDLYETLRHLFPGMALDPLKCPATRDYWQFEYRKKKRKKRNAPTEKRGYWFLKSNRRQFFITFAEEKAFDPFTVTNWYTTTKEALRSVKGSRNILYFYDTYAKALLDLFPNLPWDDSKLSHLSLPSEIDVLEEEEDRREFIKQYAEENNIDPSIPDHWYSINRSDFRATRGGRKVLSYYNNSLAKALVSLLPSVKLDPSQFIFIKSYWKDPARRRNFFETFAKKNSFNPLEPENWYSIRPEQVAAVPGGKRLLFMYGYNLFKALDDVFPGIDLQRLKFQYLRNYWQVDSNQKKFFERIAEAHHFDPLVSYNWYSLPTSSFMTTKGSGMILTMHKSFSQALADLFPDVQFDLSKFDHSDKASDFFNKAAEKNNFDPLTPENWYRISSQELLTLEGARGILASHGTFSQALLKTYPDIPFDQTKIAHLQGAEIDESRVERRRFFEEFASDHNFDPLVPDNWYLVPKEAYMHSKGVHGVLSQYSGIVRALINLFPEIGLEESKFPHYPNRHWLEMSNRRKVFETFAKDNFFDPLAPESWYQIPKEVIQTTKGVVSVLSYYNNSLPQALTDIFPSIGLDESKFKIIPKHYWKEKGNRRRYLEAFARSQGFDPLVPENWYSLPKENLIYTLQDGKIITIKGTRQILMMHGSMGQALVDLFPSVPFDRRKFMYL